MRQYFLSYYVHLFTSSKSILAHASLHYVKVGAIGCDATDPQ